MLKRTSDLNTVVAALESTSVYSIHIANYLYSCEELIGFKTFVFVLNPKCTANHKKSFIGLGKSNPIDAFVMAYYARGGNIEAELWRGSQFLALKRLTRHRLHLVECITREKAYLVSNLYLKFSELQMIEWTFKCSYYQFLQLYWDFKKELKAIYLAIEKEIKGLVPNVFIILQSINGISPVFAAGIVAKISDITTFHSSDVLAKHAGLCWKQNQSGNLDGEDTPMSKVGNRELRYYLGEAANSLKTHNVEYRTHYRKKYKEVPKRQHKSSLALTSHKFVRLIYGLLTKKPTVLRRIAGFINWMEFRKTYVCFKPQTY